MIEVAILSVLQGITEFLPISSSGHLVLGKSLLGLGDVGIRLDIFLHVGTLFAVCAFYWRIIRRIALGAFGLGGESPREAWLYCVKIVVSAVPAAVVGILLKDRIEEAFASPKRLFTVDSVNVSFTLIARCASLSESMMEESTRRVSVIHSLDVAVGSLPFTTNPFGCAACSPLLNMHEPIRAQTATNMAIAMQRLRNLFL